MTASKRVAPVVAGVLTKLAGNEEVQKAVMEKGIEVAGKLVDKHLKNIEEAQEKASDFLKKEVSILLKWYKDCFYRRPTFLSLN